MLKNFGGWPVLIKDSWNENNWDLKKLIEQIKSFDFKYKFDDLFDYQIKVNINHGIYVKKFFNQN